MSELKPCPICGGKPEFQHFNIAPNVRGRIICSCGLEIRRGANDTEDDLRIIWNTRHSPEEDALPMTDENMAAHGWKRTETCKVESSYYSDLMDVYVFSLSCGDSIWWNDEEPPNYCPDCGRKVEG